MNTNMNVTMNMHIYIEDEHKRKREREYEHGDEDGDKHEQLREDDVGFFSGSAAEAAGLGILYVWSLRLPLERERCFRTYQRRSFPSLVPGLAPGVGCVQVSLAKT